MGISWRLGTLVLAFAATGFLLTRGPVMQSSAQVTPATGAAPLAALGFASVAGYGTATTTGGQGGATVVVKNAAELQSAAERLDIKDKKQRDEAPRIILLAADIDLGELGNGKPGNQIKAVGTVRVRPHTTITSQGAARTLRRGMLDIKGTHNVIIRNLKFRDLWEEDPTGEYDSLGWDYVRITDSGDVKSHHIWVDHCDFGKVYDGQLDIVHGSDLVTVSWCRFAGDERGPQKKVMLIGHSSSSSAAADDKGRLNVTLHHNYFQNIDDRAPRARFGNIHAFNNVVDGARYATMSVSGAVTLVENNLYRDTQIATSFSHDKDSVEANRGGTMCIVQSRNDTPRAVDKTSEKGKQFEIDNNFKSNVTREKLQFNAPAEWTWENRNAVPYAYTPDAVDNLFERVSKGAGTF